ncbi:MAG: hypothetical protein M3O09_10960, partial [Acidobacteriota bacterium]|nr:hypothetical protein [Acidobacteriota bacterium]
SGNDSIKMTRLISSNRKLAMERWGDFVNRSKLQGLTDMTRSFHFSIALGDILLLHGSWYVTHTGLIRLSRRRRCAGVAVEVISELCDASSCHWTFKATIYRSRTCKGFMGYGDANPSNVSALGRGAEMRVAETRAVNRALRKAYGIGICSVEEIGSAGGSSQPTPEPRKIPPQSTSGKGFSSPPLVRDRLCQLIRQHQLDPNLVKAYAVDFCGTKTLRDASREQVEAFVEQLSDWAQSDRNALLCQLNSYSSRSEIGSFDEQSRGSKESAA